MTDLIKIPISTLAYAENGMVYGKDSSCLRVRQIKTAGVRTPDIPESLQLIGDFWERQVESELKLQHTDWKVTREQPYELLIEEWGVKLRGRADFIVEPPNTPKFLIECKALGSSSRRLKLIRKREPDAAHIAQMVGYFLASGITGGVLRYAFVQVSPDSDELMIPECQPGAENRADFSVMITHDHEIWVAGERYKHTVEEITQYMALAALAGQRSEVAARPYVDPFNPYSSPCRHCPFSEACDSYDEQSLVAETPSLTQFIESCKAIAGSLKRDTYNLFKPKKRGKA